MTSEEFELWLRKWQVYRVRKALKEGFTDEEIYCLLEEERLTEAAIQSILRMHRRLKAGEIKISDEVWEYIQNPSKEDDGEWEEG